MLVDLFANAFAIIGVDQILKRSKGRFESVGCIAEHFKAAFRAIALVGQKIPLPDAVLRAAQGEIVTLATLG